MFRVAARRYSMTIRPREAIKTPIFKSIFLTFVFGTVVVDLMKNKRELEALNLTYRAKFEILDEIVGKLENGEHVDIQRELRIANTLTKHKYNTVTDIELDEQLEQLFKEFQDKPEQNPAQETEKLPIQDVASQQQQPITPPTKIESSKFL